MLRRMAAVAVLSLLPLAAAATPAQAARSCGITVPSKVSVVSPYRTITARYSAGCMNYAESAWWDVMHPTRGLQNMFGFNGSSSESIDWYDREPGGTYTVRADGAYDDNYNEMTQNSPKMAVKLGSRIAPSSSRAGRYVTVKATATRYSPSADGYRGWAGTKVVLRQKTCSSCSWKWVKSGKTDRNGRVSLTTYAGTKRSWQVATVDTSDTWGRASSTLQR